jgi:hypothetical protein
LKVTVSPLLALTRPLTVAWAAMEEKTMALAGCGLVVIAPMFTAGVMRDSNSSRVGPAWRRLFLLGRRERDSPNKRTQSEK